MVGENHREKEAYFEDTYSSPVSFRAGRQLCHQPGAPVFSLGNNRSNSGIPKTSINNTPCTGYHTSESFVAQDYTTFADGRVCHDKAFT